MTTRLPVRKGRNLVRRLFPRWVFAVATCAAGVFSYFGLDEMERLVVRWKTPPVVHESKRQFVPPPAPVPRKVEMPESEPPEAITPVVKPLPRIPGLDVTLPPPLPTPPPPKRK